MPLRTLRPEALLKDYQSELLSLRQELDEFTTAIASLRRQCEETCGKTCGKACVFECQSCKKLVLEQLTKWLSRGASQYILTPMVLDLHHLNTRLETGPKSLGTWLAEQKNAWCAREMKDLAPLLQMVGEGRDEMRNLTERIQSWDATPSEMQKLVSGAFVDEKTPIEAELKSRLTGQHMSSAERKQTYADYLFRNQPTGRLVENGQSYVDAYMTQEGENPATVIGTALDHYERSREKKPAIDALTKRRAELRRALAAAKQKEALKKQQGGDRGVNDLYDLPPCATCDGNIRPDKVMACSLCQAFIELGLRSNPTVYCSDDCHGQGHVSGPIHQVALSSREKKLLLTNALQDAHATQAHECDAAGACLWRQNGDVAIAGMDGDDGVVLCRFCTTTLRKPTFFCCRRCGMANLESHRRSVHRGSRQDEDSKLLVSLEEVLLRRFNERHPGVKIAVG